MHHGEGALAHEYEKLMRVRQNQKMKRVKDDGLMISFEPLGTAKPEVHASTDNIVM